MRTLNINLSEQDFKKYGLGSESISFEEFISHLKTLIAKEALEKCHLAAQQSGLSSMTLEEIDAEIEAVRNAKNNH